MTTQDFTTILQERRSVRKFDPSFQLDRPLINELLTLATKAPSSRNLQPWRFIVIENNELKKAIRAAAYNQEPVEKASAVIAIVADTEMYHNAESIYKSKYDKGLMDEATMQRQISGIEQMVPQLPKEIRLNMATFDCGLVTMQIMLAARAKGLDTVPIGGFDGKALSSLLELDERFVPILLLPIGKAAEPGFETTRLPLEDIVVYR
ncbi:nitroreductase family protein [Bacillus sp. 1P06AnD]|uniref:nitroreductase family protein n=1 Tax=Bacillus sp. 1P06AnD TaxID=3132208 RepID=UPI0039A0C87F